MLSYSPDPNSVQRQSFAQTYLERLRELANAVGGAMLLQSHEAFEAEVRLRHGRKSAFWAHVNGKRLAPKDLVSMIGLTANDPNLLAQAVIYDAV